MATADVEMIQMKERSTLEVNVKVSMLGMPKAIGRTYMRLAEYLETHGGSMEGEPYVRYLDLDWDALMNESKWLGFIRIFTRKWNMLIGFPLKEGIAGEGDIKAGRFAGGSYLTTLHTGPYQKLAEAYNRLYAYAKEKGLVLQDECVEQYLNDPGSVSKEELQTVVMVPLQP